MDIKGLNSNEIAELFTYNLSFEIKEMVASLSKSGLVNSEKEVIESLPMLAERFGEMIAKNMLKKLESENEKTISAAEMIKFAEMWAGMKKSAKD